MFRIDADFYPRCYNAAEYGCSMFAMRADEFVPSDPYRRAGVEGSV